MQKEITLCIKDTLLLRAVSIMLSEAGFTFARSGEGVPTVTDDAELSCASGQVLYLLRGEPSGKKRYLQIPFSSEELITAVKELCENEKSTVTAKPKEIHLDVKNRRAVLDTKRVSLTEKECMLLALLLKNRGKTVTDDEITEKIWKNETAENSNVAAVYVNYLRTKLEGAFGQRIIFRIRGQGYMLKENERKN